MRRFRIRGTTVSHLVQNHTLSGHGNGAIFPMANCTSSATDKNRRIALLRTSLYPSPSPFGRFAAVVEPYRQRCVSLYSEGEALCFNHGYISRTTRTSRWRLFSDRMFGDTSLTDGTESRIQHNEIYDFSQTNIPARAQIPGRSIHRRFHGCFSGNATGSVHRDNLDTNHGSDRLHRPISCGNRGEGNVRSNSVRRPNIRLFSNSRKKSYFIGFTAARSDRTYPDLCRCDAPG